MQGIWFTPPGPDTVARAKVASPADVLVIEKTPYEELLPSWSILGIIDHWAASQPDKPAILELDNSDLRRVARQLTYAELAAAIREMAHRLCDASAPAPPVVSILTPLVADTFIAMWAGASAGIANPINPFLRIDHAASIMNAAGTTVLVTGGPKDGPGAWNDLGRLRAMVPSLRAVLSLDSSLDRDRWDLRCCGERHDRPQVEFSRDPHRTVALLHTGGTTAVPKLVRLTHAGQLLNAWSCGTWTDNRPEGVIGLGMPYFHVGGAVCLGLSAMVYGQTMVIVSPHGFRDPQVIGGFWDMVSAHGLTLVGSAPTTAAALVATHQAIRPPSGFRYWAGGAAVPVQVAREFAGKFGTSLCEGWGMTEVQGGLILNPSTIEPRIGSIGIPFPYHRVRCVALGSSTADEEAPPGAVGVLAVKGPCVTPGYLDAETNAALCFSPPRTSDSWLNTGDLCTIDSDGYVWHRGRSKELIIRGGHNIDPLGIESVLQSHPAVLHAAAIGAPHLEKGEIPVAYVQLRTALAATESQLLDYCQSHISERAAVPRALRIVETMPLTAVGKIYKPALRLLAVESCVQEVAARTGADSWIRIECCDSGGAITVVLCPSQPYRADLLEKFKAALERYTFRIEIRFDPV